MIQDEQDKHYTGAFRCEAPLYRIPGIHSILPIL